MAPNKSYLGSTVLLHGSAGQMPVLGFGVFQIDQPDTTTVCLQALSAGYRHIDTAQLYNNESQVGQALTQVQEDNTLSRDQIFVTTKIRYPALGKGKTYLRALKSVQKIDPRDDEGYVDLFLIHTANGVKSKDRKEMWLTLEKLQEEGRARAIGVSNYKPEHLEEMRSYASVWPPAVNQILLHPWNQQRETVDYCNEHGIVLQAFSPLARGARMNDPVVGGIAEKHGRSPAQILIRYCLQKGWVPLPKSEKEERIKENIEVFDFEMSESEMAALDGLDGQKEPV